MISVGCDGVQKQQNNGCFKEWYWLKWHLSSTTYIFEYDMANFTSQHTNAMWNEKNNGKTGEKK